MKVGHDQHLVSVIVTVYNLELYLDECINSIINQSYKQLEIILINDGSTDNSLLIINKYKELDERVIVVDQPNQGVSAARNKGIELATGTFITFVDGDDVIDLTTYEKNITLLINDPLIACLQFPILYNWKGSNPQYHCFNKDCNTEEKVLGGFLTGEITFSTCDKIFRKEVFDTLKFAIGIRYEDMLICCELADKLTKVKISDFGCYFYRAHAASFSKGILSIDKLNSFLKAADLLFVKSQPYESLNAPIQRFSLHAMCTIANGYSRLDAMNKKGLLSVYKILQTGRSIFLYTASQERLSLKLVGFGVFRHLFGTNLALIAFAKSVNLYDKLFNHS